MTPAPEWLTCDDAAAYARVSVWTIRGAAQRGDLDGCKFNPDSPRSPWRFKTTDVDAWLERGRITRGRRPRRRPAA